MQPAEFARCLGVYLGGSRLDEVDVRGHPVNDDDFILLFNAHDGRIPFTVVFSSPPDGVEKFSAKAVHAKSGAAK